METAGFLKDILIWKTFKVLMEFFNKTASVLCFSFLVTEACGILVSQPGIKPVPPELEGQVIITGPPGKSQNLWGFVLQHRSSQDGVVSCHLDLTVFMP